MFLKSVRIASAVACTLLLATAVRATEAPTLSLTHATELRADKLATAAVLQNLGADTSVRLLSSEGGWALVEVMNRKSAAPGTGWVRANALNWQANASIASGLANGRTVAGNTALTLGVRGLKPRSNRHALIIGISEYADPAIPSLPGVKLDRESATQMAQSMQVPLENIHYLEDSEATANGIRNALAELSERVQEGDRVFIHYSGHGTRYADPQSGGCVEALLAYDGVQTGLISNREMVTMLSEITRKADKLFVMYDACHSGGVAQTATITRTRGIHLDTDEGAIRPKFVNTSEECGRPTNIKTRSLAAEIASKGMAKEDIIHLSASRDNEISFDDEAKGGLATQYMRDCMLRDARDLGNSGAITIDDIRQCAQEKINQRMANSPNYQAHHLVLNGNADFVPAWFSKEALAPVQVAVPEVAPAVAPLTPPPLTGAQALQQMFAQRDGKRKVQISVAQKPLKIGSDALDFSVSSDHAGYLYVALAGSDNQSVYLLFPNALDPGNKIAAGQTLHLPRPDWRVTAGGPAGTDQLLVIVADAPRDLSALQANKAGPFVVSLNDAQGRAQLGALMTTAQAIDSPMCSGSKARASNPLCSDAYGAALFSIEERE